MSQTRADHASAERRLAYGFALAALALIASVPATGLPAKTPSRSGPAGGDAPLTSILPHFNSSERQSSVFEDHLDFVDIA
jgi:hypothetical protein